MTPRDAGGRFRSVVRGDIKALLATLKAKSANVIAFPLIQRIALAGTRPYTSIHSPRRQGSFPASSPLPLFRVRLDRLTPAKRHYLRAIAEMGLEPHRTGDIADCLNRGVTALRPMRSSLITKGVVCSVSHGDTAFVPLLAER